jgi:Xaa-Pro aminopeptidase
VAYHIQAKGPGYKGAQLVRAFPEVATGKGTVLGTLLIPSTTGKVQKGDLVMLELATVVDGYWSDLTHNTVAGSAPDARQKEVYNKVLEAQQAAAKLIKPGCRFEEPDAVARQVLKGAGLSDYFVHILGHGVGLRYHEFTPVMAPGLKDVFQEGMVCSLEPGVYIENWGGIRIEDNVAVGKDEPIFLSKQRTSW